MKNINENKNDNNNTLIESEKTEKIQIEKKKNEIPILELLKCPICKKICLMNINKEKLLFSFECTNKHKNNNKFKKCRTNANESFYSFPSDLSELNLSKEFNIIPKKINNKDNNTSKITNVTVQKLYITEKDFLCQLHPNEQFNSYCFECKKNLCDKCKEDHLNHNQVKLNSIKPNDKEVMLCKKNIKKNELILLNLIEYLQNWKKEFDKGLNTLIKIMENIFNLKDFIISNYDQKQNNQNYNYIQNFNNIKALDFVFPNLKDFNNKKDFKQSGYDIIDTIYNIQNKIIENKKKINSLNESQLKKINNNLSRNYENLEQNDIESEDTSHTVKNNNFNTTYMSDCNNNNFFSRDVRKSLGTKGTFHSNKKKILGRNKIEKILEDPNISRTIEQNNNLEKLTDLEDNNNDISEKENFILENKIILKNVEMKNDNDINIIKKEEQVEDKFIIEEDKDNNFNDENKEKDIFLNNIDIKISNTNSNRNNSINSIIKEDNNTINDIIEENNIIINNNNSIEQISNEKINLYNEEINKNIYTEIDLKYELQNTDIIRSIEFLNQNQILICTLENIFIYKIDSNYSLVKEYDIKEFNYRINYATKLLNGNLIICSLNSIDIIKLSENDLGSYDIIQKLEGKNNSENINKIKEIQEKNYLISCDKNNIILYEKNPETNLYYEKNYLKTKTEVKCLEKINENLIITVEPEIQSLIFYEIDSLKKINEINNIQSSFGRYVISYIEKYKCIFIKGRLGIYLISSINFEKKYFLKLVNGFLVLIMISKIIA